MIENGGKSQTFSKEGRAKLFIKLKKEQHKYTTQRMKTTIGRLSIALHELAEEQATGDDNFTLFAVNMF